VTGSLKEDLQGYRDKKLPWDTFKQKSFPSFNLYDYLTGNSNSDLEYVEDLLLVDVANWKPSYCDCRAEENSSMAIKAHLHGVNHRGGHIRRQLTFGHSEQESSLKCSMWMFDLYSLDASTSHSPCLGIL
jgi:hypothetical protein